MRKFLAVSLVQVADFNRLSALGALSIQQTRKIEYHWKSYKNPFALFDIEVKV
mgnify:CR=1 FL=1